MTRIGDYELLDRLGEGNYGTFFLARPPARLAVDSDLVMVKVMPAHATDRDFRRAANELRVFAALRSNRLVHVHEAGQQDGQLFYSMDWYPEGSLAEPAEPLDPRAAITCLADAARGAHELHEVGVVHRDIKPATILIDGGRGRLSDLGLAQLLSPGMTSTGIGPIGSLEYVEPDVIWGERAARATDVWSLGMTIHRVLSGDGAFGTIPLDNVLDAFRHVLHRRPEISPRLPGAVRPIVERAVAPHRAERYPTAAELADDLESVRSDL